LVTFATNIIWTVKRFLIPGADGEMTDERYGIAKRQHAFCTDVGTREPFFEK
jgi:hypothetical protein